MTKVLSITGAHKSFGATKALAGASLHLHEGERLALLGPNGAGKTTLVRSIAGRIVLDDGTIELFGEKLNGRTDTARQKLGIVPQETAVYPLLTARENLEVFGAFHGLAGQPLQERVDWALEWTGLADRSRESVKRFSGGMKRRLNLACSILHHPPVILLDEPTTGVDPQSRQRIWEMLDQLQQDGSSILLTTHQLDEAQKICSRIVIIDHGAVVADGTFEELLQRTLGSKRRVTFVFAGTPPESLMTRGFEADESNDRVLCGRVERVAAELPHLLSQIEDSGADLVDLQLEEPTLQNVFIHLTGRELRE